MPGTPESPMHEAAIPNPALAALLGLVGRWTTVGSHPMLPNPLHGHAIFEWMDGGAFLVLRSEIDEPGVPTSVSVIGRDEDGDGYSMLYFDERGVSRVYQMSFDGAVWKLWRPVPGFSQRFTGTFSEDSNTIVGVWEVNEDGTNWVRDLEITYTRAQ